MGAPLDWGMRPDAGPQPDQVSCPVWERVRSCADGARLLAVQAPAGSGRGRLIAAWRRSLAERGVEHRVIDAQQVRAALPAGQEYDDAAAVTAALATQHDQRPDVALAIVLPPQPAAAEAARAAGAVVLEAGDLLLRRDEAAAYCGEDAPWFEAARAQFGGWMRCWTRPS